MHAFPLPFHRHSHSRLEEIESKDNPSSPKTNVMVFSPLRSRSSLIIIVQILRTRTKQDPNDESPSISPQKLISFQRILLKFGRSKNPQVLQQIRSSLPAHSITFACQRLCPTVGLQHLLGLAHCSSLDPRPPHTRRY